MVERNRAREEFGSSQRLKGIQEINEKKLTYVKAIHVDKVVKDNRNWDNLWGIANTLFDIVEENKIAVKECIDDDARMMRKVMLKQFWNLSMYSIIVRLYYFLLGTPIHKLD